MLENLIAQGEYEDALLYGEQYFKKYKEKDTAMYVVSAALLSKATYHWYQFKVSDKYFEVSLASLSTLKNAKDKFIASVYIADAALHRHDFFSAIQVLNAVNENVTQQTAAFQVKYFSLKAEVLSGMGENKPAIGCVLEASRIANELYEKDNSKALAEWAFEIGLAKSRIYLTYGDRAEAEAVYKKWEKFAEENKLRSKNIKYLKAKFQADLAFQKRFYKRASEYYLAAYNHLDFHTEEYRKYDALKQAAISSIKAGNVADYQKLFRRSDMLAFKKPLRSQTFRPGVFQLRLVQLIQQGQYSLAIDKIEEIGKNYAFLPRSNPYFLEFLELKAEASEAAGKIELYNSVLDSILVINTKKYGDTSLYFAKAKLRKAEAAWKYEGKFSEAIALYKSLYDKIIVKKLAPNAMDKLNYLYGYTQCYEGINMFDSAYAQANTAYKIVEKSISKNTAEYFYFTSMAAYEAFNTGKYADIDGLLSNVKVWRSNTIEEQQPYYIKALFLQAQMYQWLGEFSFMNERLGRAQKVSLSKDEPRFFEKMEVSDALARSNMINANYIRADKNIKLALTGKTKALGSSSFLLINSLLISTELKIQKGDLREADAQLNTGEDLIKNNYSTKSASYAQWLFLNSKYHFAIADYKEAKESLLESISILGTVFGKTHVRLSPLYAELAKTYMSENISNSKLANSTYENAKNIVRSAFGTENPAYAILEVEQAKLQIEIQNFEEAAQNLFKAEKFWTTKLGEENIYTAEIYLVQGLMNYKKKNYANAEKLYKKSAQQYSSIFNSSYIHYLTATTGLAKVAYMYKDYEKADQYIKEVLNARLKFTTNNFSVMSSGQKSGFWAQFKEEFELANAISYVLITQKGDKKSSISLYNRAINTKGMLLNSDARLRKVVFESGDSILIATFNEWLEQKEFFASASAYSNAQLKEENISLDKIEGRIADLEKKINQKINGDINANHKMYDWVEVREALPKRSSAVEVMRFRYFSHEFTDSVVYAALIINENTKAYPQAVFLGEGKKMEKGYLKYYRNATIGKIDDLNSYQAFFAPIKDKIPDNHTIFFAGEGVYTQLNVEMLLNPEKNQFALQANSFVFITNTKDMIPEEKQKKTVFNVSQSNYYLYGNPKFYTIPVGKESVPPLEGAETEVKAIYESLKSSKRNATMMLGSNITEDTLKSMQNPYVLHISTHGFFMENAGNGLTNNPMLNSGLMLTGSGDILEKNIGYVNQKPGILTASEVMDMNFTNTQLVVLSACETGRGQVEVGEGVFGLQRAFLVAGAKSIILSLFKVDDEATQLLMQNFYKKMIANGGDYRTAFREAKNELRKDPRFQAPAFWGAFIMVEGKQRKG
mgnify:CR=1 FL=1